MRSRKFIALAALSVAFGGAALATMAYAQNGISRAAASANGGNVAAVPVVPPLAPGAADSTNDGTDQTLEIAPRVLAPPPASDGPPAANDSSTTDNNSGAPAAASADLNVTAPADEASATPKRPYLGIAVQTIYADDQPGHAVMGLEVVSVDPGSPAALAGLRGRTQMTSVGASGATAGALLPPLDLIMMPLLKKTGSLGQTGDLIVAVDDRRVTNDLDLQSELASLKPGDTIYLTIVRAGANGVRQTLKLPVKLADAATAVANAGSASAPSDPNAPRR